LRAKSAGRSNIRTRNLNNKSQSKRKLKKALFVLLKFENVINRFEDSRVELITGNDLSSKLMQSQVNEIYEASNLAKS